MLSPFDRRQQSREFGKRPDMGSHTSTQWKSGSGHRQRERNSEVRQSNGVTGYSLDHNNFDEVVNNTSNSWLQN